MNKNMFHILVVDDDDRIRELVKEYLNENKFIVTTAKDAQDAKNKIKIIFLIIVAFIIYKVVVALKDFEIGVSKKVSEIEELADFEKEEEVIGLMMYLGDPLELKEHLFTESRSKCLQLKNIAEESSFAYYECAKVNAVLKDKKIVRIIEEIEVIE